MNTDKDPEIYPLDDAAAEYLAKLNDEIKWRDAAAAGCLTYFMRLHKLEGNWKLAPNGKELILERTTVPK